MRVNYSYALLHRDTFAPVLFAKILEYGGTSEHCDKSNGTAYTGVL